MFSAIPFLWGVSSAGRAPALHAGGQEFDPPTLHHMSISPLDKGLFLFISYYQTRSIRSYSSLEIFFVKKFKSNHQKRESPFYSPFDIISFLMLYPFIDFLSFLSYKISFVTLQEHNNPYKEDYIQDGRPSSKKHLSISVRAIFLFKQF